jgi:2-amino-4-hydroxy-6-hydroxymethyldihydropteridine diphosphokinase
MPFGFSMPSPVPERATLVGFSLGSNMGDAPANLSAALTRLTARRHVILQAVSSIYRTKPWGPVPQDDFANLCATGLTDLSPLALLDEVKAVETELGRTPGERWGPRLIDIDIVFYGDVRLDTERLTLPHRDASKRAFVMVPLAEIAPDLVLGDRCVADHAAALGAHDVALWRSPPDGARA